MFNPEKDIEIVKVSYEWLETYCKLVGESLQINRALFWERYALIDIQQYSTFTNIWSINVKGDEELNLGAGFAITPSFETNILSSIFIHPRYRRQGICSEIVNRLRIEKLSCLVDNIDALRLYRNLGFKTIETTDPFKGSLKLERTI